MGDSGTIMKAGVGEAPKGSRVFTEHRWGAQPEGGPGAIKVGGSDV